MVFASPRICSQREQFLAQAGELVVAHAGLDLDAEDRQLARRSGDAHQSTSPHLGVRVEDRLDLQREDVPARRLHPL